MRWNQAGFVSSGGCRWRGSLHSTSEPAVPHHLGSSGGGSVTVCVWACVLENRNTDYTAQSTRSESLLLVTILSPSKVQLLQRHSFSVCFVKEPPPPTLHPHCCNKVLSNLNILLYNNNFESTLNSLTLTVSKLSGKNNPCSSYLYFRFLHVRNRWSHSEEKKKKPEPPFTAHMGYTCTVFLFSHIKREERYLPRYLLTNSTAVKVDDL